MEKENKELKRIIVDLEDELAAAMQREELLLKPAGGTGGLKQKIKRTKLGKIAANPNSKLGKLVRSPRTIFRIITHPNIIREMKAERREANYANLSEEKEDSDSIFVPIKYFLNDCNSKERVNLVMKGMDLELAKIAIKVANEKDVELRVIVCDKSADPIKYEKMVKEKKLPRAKHISFYSTVDQSLKNKVFELEVGKNEYFITRAWKSDDK